jgi:hypothetical protein
MALPPRVIKVEAITKEGKTDAILERNLQWIFQDIYQKLPVQAASASKAAYGKLKTEAEQIQMIAQILGL